MSRETLEWLHWLVSVQQISVGAPDAAVQVAAALRALTEITDALEATDG